MSEDPAEYGPPITHWATSLSVEASTYKSNPILLVRENCNGRSLKTELPQNATQEQIAQLVAESVRSLLSTNPEPFQGFRDEDGTIQKPAAVQLLIANRIGKPFCYISTELTEEKAG